MRYFALTLLLPIACGRAGDVPATGSEGGACYGNDTCNEGLICRSSTCVSPAGPSPGTPTGPVVCGDHVVGAGEGCDDGNLTDGDGCAADCTLESAGAGGTSCSSPTEIPLVPVGPGVLGGTGGGIHSGDAVPFPCATVFSSEVFVVHTPGAGTLAAVVSGNADSGIAVRSGDCVSAAGDLGCSDAHMDEGAEAIEVAISASGPQYLLVGLDSRQPYDLTVTFRPDTPVADTGCGDGIPGVTEECDDGNRAGGDGCSSECLLEDQGPGGESCLDSKELTLVPITPSRIGARAESTLVGANPDLANCNGENGAVDQMFRLTSPTTGRMTFSVSPRSDWNVGLDVRRDSCADVQNPVCEDMGVWGDAEVGATNVAAGDEMYITVLSLDGEGPYVLEVYVE